MKKKIALLLVLVMLFSLFAAGCGGGDEKVVKIGVFEPATGDNGAGGKQETLGIQYANSIAPTVDIGGETYNVKLEIVDNESSPEKGISAAQNLVTSGVSMILGTYGSGVAIAADYKKPAYVTQYAPDGTLLRIWNLEGVWPSAVDYGQISYESPGVKTINITLQYDKATISREHYQTEKLTV